MTHPFEEILTDQLQQGYKKASITGTLEQLANGSEAFDFLLPFPAHRVCRAHKLPNGEFEMDIEEVSQHFVKGAKALEFQEQG